MKLIKYSRQILNVIFKPHSCCITENLFHFLKLKRIRFMTTEDVFAD